MGIAQIANKIAKREPVSVADAAFLYENAQMSELRELSGLARSHWHHPQKATYLIMAILNYTNICVARCDYCSFYRLPGKDGAYLLDDEQVFAKIDALLAIGGQLVGFNGGFNPSLRLEHYLRFYTRVHERYPHVGFYDMTVAEFMFICKVSNISYEEGAAALKDSGVKVIGGGGAEILDDGFRRRHSRRKYTVADYFKAQQAILDAGIGSTATMVIGFDETLEERLNHLEALRSFQERQEEMPLPSFLCWTYKPFNNALGGTEVGVEEYWRWLAVSRIFLHNIEHIRTSVLTKNELALQGLLYGANDFDLPTEDEVTQRAGARIEEDRDKVLQFGRDLGFELIKRGPWKAGVKSDSFSPSLKAQVYQNPHLEAQIPIGCG